MIVKVISLWQPWASLVAYGIKVEETRTWKTTHRGPLAIHAAKRTAQYKFIARDAPELHKLCTGVFGANYAKALPRGAVVGKVNLVECIRTEDWEPSDVSRICGDFRPGRFAWLFNHPRKIQPPILLRGQQNIWEESLPI